MVATLADTDLRGRGVALCIIAKNEQANLAGCLESAAGLVGEVVMVDTGSTDGTGRIAAGFGARVIDFPWIDDFSAARNEALRHATAPWILSLDADDRLDEANRRRLAAVIAGLKPAMMTGFVLSCVSHVAADFQSADRIPDAPIARHRTAIRVDQVRLFPNHPALRWRYRVHEQILPALLGQGGNLVSTDVQIQHIGYHDPAVLRQKLQRNLALLERDLADRPDDPYVVFNLGWTRLQTGQAPAGLQLLERCLTELPADDAVSRKAHALLAAAWRERGHTDTAVTWCRRGLALFPDDTELLFQEAMLLFAKGLLDQAAGRLERLLTGQPPRYLAFGIEEGLRSYRARYNLGIICRDRRRFAEAEAHWRQCLAEEPAYDPPRLALTELLIAQKRWDEAGDMTAALAGNPAHVLDADILRARIHFGRGRLRRARRLLERTIARQPNALWPRLLLGRMLHDQATDLPAARALLRSVLALQPNHPEALARLHALAATPDS